MCHGENYGEQDGDDGLLVHFVFVLFQVFQRIKFLFEVGQVFVIEPIEVMNATLFVEEAIGGIACQFYILLNGMLLVGGQVVVNTVRLGEVEVSSNHDWNMLSILRLYTFSYRLFCVLHTFSYRLFSVFHTFSCRLLAQRYTFSFILCSIEQQILHLSPYSLNFCPCEMSTTFRHPPLGSKEV